MLILYIYILYVNILYILYVNILYILYYKVIFRWKSSQLMVFFSAGRLAAMLG